MKLNKKDISYIKGTKEFWFYHGFFSDIEKIEGGQVMFLTHDVVVNDTIRKMTSNVFKHTNQHTWRLNQTEDHSITK